MLSLDAMTCLSRNDSNKINIFAKKEGKKRWNLFALVDVHDGMLICKNKNYSIDELCHSSQKQNCTLKSGEVVELSLG